MSDSVRSVEELEAVAFRALQKFGALIKEERKQKDVKQDAAARALDIEGAYLSRLEKGRQAPSDELVLRIAKYYKLDADDLMRMLAPVQLAKLPRAWHRVIYADPTKPNSTPVASTQTFKDDWLPIVGQASCGPLMESINQGRSATGESYKTRWPEASKFVRSKNAFVVTAEGNSMMPTIHEGDELLVDPDAARFNGCIVLARVRDDQTVKRWELKDDVVSLIPDNNDRQKFKVKKYPIEEWNDMEAIAWRVVKVRSSRDV